MRRSQCENAASALGKDSLRDATMKDLEGLERFYTYSALIQFAPLYFRVIVGLEHLKRSYLFTAKDLQEDLADSGAVVHNCSVTPEQVWSSWKNHQK